MTDKFDKVLAKAQENLQRLTDCSHCASLRAENEKLKNDLVTAHEGYMAKILALVEAREILKRARDSWNDPHYYTNIRQLACTFLEKTK